MKITILQEKLKQGLSVVERIPTKFLTLPILNNVLISVEKNFLNLTTTDLEIGVNWWGSVKTEKEGKIAVPIKILSNILNFLPNKPINLTIKDFILDVECEDKKIQIKGFSSEEFPIIPKVPENDLILIDCQKFCQGLNQVVDIATFSTTKPEISGILFIFQKDLIVMTATDGFRLGEKRIPLDSSKKNTKDYTFILPQRAAKELINIFGDCEGDLKIFFSPNQVMFESNLSGVSHPHVQFISRLIEGEYPNYQEIIPKKYETQVVLSKNDLNNHIKLASVFSGKMSDIKLRVDPKNNKIDFSSENADLGEYKSSLSGKIEGRACDIAFNYRFLNEGVYNIKGQDIVLELNGPEKPGVLRPKGDSNYLYLVMPIKTT